MLLFVRCVVILYNDLEQATNNFLLQVDKLMSQGSKQAYYDPNKLIWYMVQFLPIGPILPKFSLNKSYLNIQFKFLLVLIFQCVMGKGSKDNDEESKPTVAKSAVELQRFKLAKLMKNPVSNFFFEIGINQAKLVLMCTVMGVILTITFEGVLLVYRPI